MYPNPAHDELHINIDAIPEGKGGFVLIQNMKGQTIERITVNPDDTILNIDISSYDAGAYILTMGSYKSEKIERFIKIQ